MKRNKQGVSLIVLVITIIIMIILASAIIITLSNSDIIERANEAVDKTDLQEAQNIASIAWSEAYLDGKTTKDELTQAVLDAFTKNKVDKSKYTLEVTTKGVKVKAITSVPEEWQASVREVTVDGVPIPIGFVKSPYAGEGTKDGGLVIYALTPDEINEGKTTITDAHQTALENRNQFVWVPVDSDKFETLFKRRDFINATSKISNRLETDYWELVLETNNMPSNNTKNITNYVSPATLQEATAMYASVKKYGGFYIARYEAGKNDAGEVSITMGKYPYHNVAWGTSMSNEVKTNGAVTLSRSFYPSTGTTYGVVSTLTYSVQWDRTINWWKELYPNFDLTNSTDYGVHKDTEIELTEYNSGAKSLRYNFDKGEFVGSWASATKKYAAEYYLMTTGAYKKANVYNIYDMAGNLVEWTMEGYSSFYRVCHGGYFYNNGGSFPVASRFNCAPTNALSYNGFRPSLYIK